MNLKRFKKQLKLIKAKDFKCIAVTRMFCEDTFVFETKEEAEKAHQMFENQEKSLIQGWWYGKEEFLETIKTYEYITEGKANIIWL